MPTHDAAGRPLDPRRWKALSVGLVAAFMTLLDVSIVNVALPSIRDGLGATSGDLSWVLSGYALAFGLVLIPAGRLGDARGRRTVFMLGLALFTLASGACGVAPNPTWLILARLAQGMAGGMLNPQVAGMIQALFRGPERGRAFGLLGATAGLSTAVGPVLGGVIITSIGGPDAWRWVFLVNLPIGLLALLLAWRLIPTDLGSGRRESLDPVGVLLLSVGLFLLLVPLAEAQRVGVWVWLMWPGSAVALAGFLAWERRHRSKGRAPLVDLALLRRWPYLLGVTVGLLYFAGFTSIFFVITLWLQAGLGYSALVAGLVQTPFAIGGALGAVLGGRLVSRFGRSLVATGLSLTTVGLVITDLLIGWLDPATAVVAILLPMGIAGIGSGFTISPNQALTLAEAPVAGAGSAAGVLQTGQRVGTALGIAAVAAVFFAALDGDDWSAALAVGLRVSVGFVVVALGVALLDLLGNRRARLPTRKR